MTSRERKVIRSIVPVLDSEPDVSGHFSTRATSWPVSALLAREAVPDGDFLDGFILFAVVDSRVDAL